MHWSMMEPPSNVRDEVVQSPLMSADGNLRMIIRITMVRKDTNIFTDHEFGLLHAVNLANDLPLTVLLRQGEHVIEGGQFAE